MKDEIGAWLRGTTFLSPNYHLRRMPQLIIGAISKSIMLSAGQLLFVKVAVYAIYTAGTYYALKALSDKANSLSGMGGTLANIQQVDAAKQVIYGQTRVGGVVTYLESTNDQGTLHMVLCLAGHEVEEIGDIYINDQRIDKSNIGSGAAVGGNLVDDDWQSKSGSYPIIVRKGDGTSSQNAQAIGYFITQTENADIDSNFDGNDVSFIYMLMNYDKDVFSDGVPTFGAVVKGRKIYDPRKDSTSDAYDASLGVSTHRKTDSSTWEYSANAALCIMDYITQDHGLNAGFEEIDDVSWATEADHCDDDVTLEDDTTEKRYEINGVFTRDRAPNDVLPAMLSACGGSLFYAQGKWVLRVGVYRNPESGLVFDEDDLRGGLNIDTKTSRRDNFNSVVGQFQEPSADWVPTDYNMITSSTFETEDGGERNILDLPLPFTTSHPMAQRLAKQTLYRVREQITVSARFGIKAFQVQVGDTIQLTNARMGWSSKTFEVTGWKFVYGDGADIQIDMTLKEISSDVFDWNAEETAFSQDNTTLPKFTYAPQPTFDGTPTTEVIIQTDGTTTANAEVAWTVTDDSLVNDYVLEWKRTGETDYQSFITTNQFYRIPAVQVGDTYDLRISSRNRIGIASDTTTTTITIAADTTAPAAPTSVSGSGGYRSNFISWTNPTDDDLKEIQVYVNTSNTSTGATLLGTTAATEFVHGGLAQSTTRYYFLKAVDFTGNVSDFSTGTGAVTTEADPQDGVDGTNGTNGTDGADGDTGDTVISGRVYYQTIQSSAPSTPSATSYNVSTASFSGLTSGWALTQPQIDITDTSIKEWSSAFTVKIDGVTSAQTIVFTTPTGAIQVAADLESDNYVADTSGWKIERDTGFAEFGSAAIRGTLTASQIQIDNVTLDSDGSGNLIIKSGGVDTTQLAANSVTKAGTSGQSSFTLTAGSTKDVTASITNCDSGSELVILFNWTAGSSTAGDLVDLSILRGGSVVSGIGAVTNAPVQDFFGLPSAYMMRITATAGTNTVGVRITANSGNTSSVIGIVYGLFALEVKK